MAVNATCPLLGVAGVYTPAFVERARSSGHPARTAVRVAGVYTPAFVERTPAARRGRHPAPVSPEFILRPSLSEPAGAVPRRPVPERVAGVYTPAFVERRTSRAAAGRCGGVAGVYTPAFVERWRRRRSRGRSGMCRRSLYSGLR